MHLDEASGVNDGSLEGNKYFECPDKHGVFVKSGILRVAEVTAIDASAVKEVHKVPEGAITRSKSSQQIQAQPKPHVLASVLEDVIVPGSAAEEVVPATRLDADISVNVVKPAGISQGEVGGARLEAAIADNYTQFGITGGPVSQSGVPTAVVDVAGAGSNAGVMQPSAPSPVLGESFSEAEKIDIAFFVGKL